jgi:hypothetical protein
METDVRDRIEREAASAFGLAIVIYGPPTCRPVLPIFVQLFCARQEAVIQLTRLAFFLASCKVVSSNQQRRIYESFDIVFVSVFQVAQNLRSFQSWRSLVPQESWLMHFWLG